MNAGFPSSRSRGSAVQIGFLAPLQGAGGCMDKQPRVSHKTLHPGLIFLQPSGLRTPEAWSDFSPGYAFFAYPG